MESDIMENVENGLSRSEYKKQLDTLYKEREEQIQKLLADTSSIIDRKGLSYTGDEKVKFVLNIFNGGRE